MKKIWLILTILILTVFTGCGEKNIAMEKLPDEENPMADNVKIYMPVPRDAESGQAYVEELRDTYLNQTFEYYNEEYFITYCSERTRAARLKKLNPADNGKTYLIDEIERESGERDVITGVEIDEKFQNVVLKVDGQKYDDADIFLSMYMELICKNESEEYQTYALIPPEERESHYKIIDDQTGEVYEEE